MNHSKKSPLSSCSNIQFHFRQSKIILLKIIRLKKFNIDTRKHIDKSLFKFLLVVLFFTSEQQEYVGVLGPLPSFQIYTHHISSQPLAGHVAFQPNSLTPPFCCKHIICWPHIIFSFIYC